MIELYVGNDVVGEIDPDVNSWKDEDVQNLLRNALIGDGEEAVFCSCCFGKEIASFDIKKPCPHRWSIWPKTKDGTLVKTLWSQKNE